MIFTNCKRVARLLPLQVAGDLPEARQRTVTRHLATCAGCRQLAEEFAESRRWLTQGCKPPEFTADFYAGIRSTVLDEIARQRMVSKPKLLGRWGHRPWLYATAFAALVIAFGLLLNHFNTGRRQAPGGLAVAPPAVDQRTLAPQGPERAASSQKPSSSGDVSSSHGPRKLPVNRVPVLANEQRRSGPVERFNRQNLPGAIATGRDWHSVIAQLAPPLTASWPGSVKSAAFPGESGTPASGQLAATQVSRIEIQTANPNIRIIWLGAQQSRANGEVDHDQDQNENGK